MKKKLIEVALPLEAINLESAREKSIRHGHPSTLHLWWARRPLAACRAVLWGSLVDDPSSWPDKFPTEADQERERQRLFDILGRIEIQKDKKGKQTQVVRGLVSWDEVNDPNSDVLLRAQREIARCLAWERGEEPPTDPAAVRDYIAQYAPPVYDPFAGGGSIPLEAQRLGLEAHASDLNPVAVLINKALIEIPPKFRDLPPVNPVDCPHPALTSSPSPRGRGGVAGLNRWYGAQGLAADVRFYGAWMRDEAFQRIGHLYPKVALTPRPPLPKGEGETSALIPQPLLSKGEGETSALIPQPLLPRGEGETSALTPQPLLSKGEGETSALIPQPLLSKGEGETSALTPQPPLPKGEGEIERWEIPLATQKKMQEVARQLRRQSTPSEAILWEALRNRRLAGRKFRRQHSIGTFVVDFFCQEEALIVEVDGPIHEHQPDLDRQWQELLEGLGLRFVRLSSHLVETNLPLALEQIRSDFLPSPAGIESESEGQATVIAWLWARTVTCPNPACGCAMPLVRSFQLSTKKGKEAWVEPVIERTSAPLTPQPPLPWGEGELNSLTPQPPLPRGEGEKTQNPLPQGEGRVRVKFVVKSGEGKAPEGTVDRKGARCIACGTPVPLEYVRQEGRAGRMGAQLMAIVAEGPNGRVYLSPQQEQVEIAESAQPTWKPDADLPHNPRDFKTPNYGMRKISDLFTPRQLVALTTFSDLVAEAREKAIADAIAAGLPDDDVPLAEGGTGARAYGEAISVYLAFAVDKAGDYWSGLCSWHSSGEKMRNTFARQAIPMVWDYAECCPFSESTGNWMACVDWVWKVVEKSSSFTLSKVTQHDATAPHPHDTTPKLISTDPPYCLAPDTLIQTTKGYVPIQDIQVGDRVLTHKGQFSAVINTSKRWYEGDIYYLTVAGINHPLILTGEHPIYGIQTNPCGYQFSYCHPDCSYLKSQGRCRHQAFANYQLDWIPASQAKPFDLIFLPTLTTEQFQRSIALQDWLPEDDYLERDGLLHYQKATSKSLSRREQQTATLCRDRQYTIPAHLKITPALCRLIGFFIAEGYARLESDGGTIQFTLHWEEQNLQADIIQLMQACFGLAPGKTTDNRKNNNNSFRLNFYSKPITTLFRTWFYTEEGQKCLPQWVLELPAEFLEELIKGYWWGDGYRANSGYKAVTVSPALAGQIQLILQKIGIRSCLHTRTVKSTIVNGNPVIARYPQHNITVNGSSLLKLAEYIGEPKHESLSLKRFSQHGYWWNNGYLAPIRKVERKPYIGYVYNLETVDHSYTTAMGCVHNCDNIGYADLSDFFYVWLRRSLGSVYPNIFSTLLVPKAQELVSTPYRFEGSKQKAKEFFEEGIKQAFSRMRAVSHDSYPVTIFYAFKQQEEDPSPPGPLSQKGRGGVGSPHPPAPSPQGRGGEEDEDMDDPVPLSQGGRGQGEGRASTGWETMLEGLMQSGLTINGTWPMRSELANRMVASGTNALASSIVLVCRPRPADAPKATRRQFLSELQQELPKALHALQQGSIAPVDLAQASIGPGMAIYSRYAAVLENDGSPLTVRTALQLINQYLDEYLTEQEGEFDSDTRWAITWFQQHQFEPGPYGEAETLSKARNVSVQGLVEAGILEAKGGKVRLLKRESLTLPTSLSLGEKEGQDPDSPSPSGRGVGVRVNDWLIAQTLIHTLDVRGEMEAAALLATLENKGAIARDLAYRLYTLCDKKGWTQEAIAYNSLVISWPEINRLASEVTTKQHDPLQTSFL